MVLRVRGKPRGRCVHVGSSVAARSNGVVVKQCQRLRDEFNCDTEEIGAYAIFEPIQVCRDPVRKCYAQTANGMACTRLKVGGEMQTRAVKRKMRRRGKEMNARRTERRAQRV